jgi:predicted ATP-grasp superfamily ATP-dependent carboligase
VVLQASGPNALGIVRSLGRAGVPVIACDHDPQALGLRSRYVRPHLTRDPLADPEGFCADLAELGATLPERGVLFCTHDEALAAIGPREEALARWFARPWSPWATLAPVLDKGAQHAAARRIGFPVPITVEPRDERDVERAAHELRFPMILKPREAPEFRRRFRAQVLECRDADELRANWELAAPYGPQISEVIPGGDECLWTLGSYRDAQGRPLASFTGRKLRQWPPRFGTARAAESRWDPDLAGRCHALLDELGFHGISQVEVKRDPRDGRDHLIEVNPRSWLWISLATACGVNIPRACWMDATGTPARWRAGHRSGLRWTLGAKHLAASVREVRRGRWDARSALASVRPPIVDGVLDPRDPVPALAQYARLARLARGRR